MSRTELIRKINITLSNMKHKIEREQSNIVDENLNENKLYSVNEIVEYYYVNLWGIDTESEGI